MEIDRTDGKFQISRIQITMEELTNKLMKEQATHENCSVC